MEKYKIMYKALTASKNDFSAQEAVGIIWSRSDTRLNWMWLSTGSLCFTGALKARSMPRTVLWGGPLVGGVPHTCPYILCKVLAVVRYGLKWRESESMVNTTKVSPDTVKSL